MSVTGQIEISAISTFVKQEDKKQLRGIRIKPLLAKKPVEKSGTGKPAETTTSNPGPMPPQPQGYIKAPRHDFL